MTQNREKNDQKGPKIVVDRRRSLKEKFQFKDTFHLSFGSFLGVRQGSS